MNYTLTKYLSSDYFRENEFTKAFLELVDEIIFCCYMESREILSQLSFETMDDNYFLTYQDFFLNGLSTYNIKDIDKTVLSEWFSLLHVRGELSDLFKLFKFGGSLTKPEINNDLKLYNNADVPETITPIGVDGIIYAITEENISLTDDFFINQQVPAGYRLGVIKQTPPFYIYSSDDIEFKKERLSDVIVIDYGVIDLEKEKQSDVHFYRRRQFDQTYSFKQLYQSGYTINELSKFHQDGVFYFGYDRTSFVINCTIQFVNSEYPQFDIPLPSSVIVTKGSTITLPSVSGTYEEGDYIYTPLKWNIGEFGEDYIVTESVTAELQWNVKHKSNYLFGDITLTSFNGVSANIRGITELNNVDVPQETLSEFVLNPFGNAVINDLFINTINTSDELIPPSGAIEEYVPKIGSQLCGSIGENFSESIIGSLPDNIENGTLEFDVELRNITVDSIPERIENGTLEFTTELRENILPESGVVTPYVAKYSYIVLDKDTGKPTRLNTDTGIGYADVAFVSLQDDPLLIIEKEDDGIEILLGSQWNGSTWAGGEVQYQNSSIARIGVMSQTDADLITGYGLTLTGEILAYHSGPFGFINYNPNYEFEVIGVYTDVSGETPVSTDILWFAMNYNNNWVNLGGAGWGPPYLVSGIKTVRVKIKLLLT